MNIHGTETIAVTFHTIWDKHRIIIDKMPHSGNLSQGGECQNDCLIWNCGDFYGFTRLELSIHLTEAYNTKQVPCFERMLTTPIGFQLSSFGLIDNMVATTVVRIQHLDGSGLTGSPHREQILLGRVQPHSESVHARLTLLHQIRNLAS